MSKENLQESDFEVHGFKEEVEYASFWIRVAATLIDTIVFIPLIALSFANLFYVKSLILLYVMMVLQSLYKPLMEFKYGATLGKMAVKIKVVNEEHNPITLDQSFGRYVPWVISTVLSLITSTAMYMSADFNSLTSYMQLAEFSENLPLNTVSQVYNVIFFIIIIWMTIDKRNQGVHDKIAKTMVIKTKKD
ncbi:MAG: RDD family protein [Vicingaceae bacterium]